MSPDTDGHGETESAVLIAASTAFLRDLLRASLTPTFSIIGTAENGVEAVDMYNTHTPDVVILDVDLPMQDGIQTTAEITQEDSQTPVVICLGAESHSVIQRARQAGAAGVITPPFQQQALQNEIRTHLSS